MTTCPARLESIPLAEQHPDITCEWSDSVSWGYGPDEEIPCREQATVWFVYEEYWPGSYYDQPELEEVAVNFCRLHGDQVLISERENRRRMEKQEERWAKQEEGSS